MMRFPISALANIFCSRCSLCDVYNLVASLASICSVNSSTKSVSIWFMLVLIIVRTLAMADTLIFFFKSCKKSFCLTLRIVACCLVFANCCQLFFANTCTDCSIGNVLIFVAKRWLATGKTVYAAKRTTAHMDTIELHLQHSLILWVRKNIF